MVPLARYFARLKILRLLVQVKNEITLTLHVHI
jgi:hypothetical protein